MLPYGGVGWQGGVMTRTSQAGGEFADLVGVHGAELHRLAVVLTADTDAATNLIVRTLSDCQPQVRLDVDRLKRDLVRHYLRSAPRRVEGLGSTGGDAGDVLRHLGPRARAACALRLMEGWDADGTAAAVGVSRRKIDTLVPSVAGLDLALTGLGDQHALAGSEVEQALLEAVPHPRAPSGGRHRRRAWLAAATAALVLVGGYLLVDDRAGRDDDLVDDAGTVATIGQIDLTEAGWRLNDDGDPPRMVNGLYLRETVTLDEGGRRTAVSLPTPPMQSFDMHSFAGFGVLWCDMPPAQDEHLVVPSGTLRIDGVRVDLPCAGKDGSPPVTQVVALPPGGEGVLEVIGDVPGNGGATLAVYHESDTFGVPAPRDGVAQAPPVDAGALALDPPDARPSGFPGFRTVQAVSVGHESTIRVWAGRTGSISINVDGVPTTDDGDIAAMVAMMAAWEEQAPHDEQAPIPEWRDHIDWSTQQADVRDGRWLVPVPDMVRTFPLPEQVLPAPGERHTVTVEVMTENVEGHLQVVLTDAQPVQVDTAPVLALSAPDAPLFALGHRLVGQWLVPSDGHLRELKLDGSAALPEETVVLITREPDPSSWNSWGEGLVNRGGEDLRMWGHGDLDRALGTLQHSQFAMLPDGPGPLRVAAPPAPGRPSTAVLAYTPVSYEEFDFTNAAVPPDAWPAGSAPAADPHTASHLPAYQTVGVVGTQDAKDGQVRLRVAPFSELAVQVTTEGKGRMQFLIDNQPAYSTASSDGWWSSWTDQPVTSQFSLAHGMRADIELTVVVEDYENFTIEVLTS